MSFLIGKTRQDPNVNRPTQQFHQQFLQALLGGGGQGLERLFPPSIAAPGTPGTTVDQASIQPYLDLFAQQNSRNLAQAKESAGNLTGSGLASLIGQEAGRADVEQGGFLANLFEQRRRGDWAQESTNWAQSSQNRAGDANRFLQGILGGAGSPAGGVQTSYQPGALDYLFQGAGAAAKFIPGAG
jgi:hypothetical protein